MPTVPNINLPELSALDNDHRSTIENHVLGLLNTVAGDDIFSKKYYKSANEQIYEDCLNRVNGGVPAWLLRTTSIETNEYSPVEKGDNNVASLEVIHAVNVQVEKNVYNVDRYAYTMEVLVRELLRANPIKELPHPNRRRPYIYLGCRDIYRDDEVDIVISEFNVDYIEV